MSLLNPIVEELAIAVVERAQRNLGAFRVVNGKKRRSVSTGTLKNSLTYVNKSRNGGNTVQFTALGTAKDYAQYVHYGRRPGSTPPKVEPIKKWIREKPIRIRDRSTGRIMKSTEGRITSLAFAIARSIGKKGIPAFPFFDDAIREELEIRGPLFLDALERELELRLNLK